MTNDGEVVWRETPKNPNELVDVPGDDGTNHHRVGHRLRVQRHLRPVVPVYCNYIVPTVCPIIVLLVIQNEVFQVLLS